MADGALNLNSMAVWDKSRWVFFTFLLVNLKTQTFQYNIQYNNIKMILSFLLFKVGPVSVLLTVVVSRLYCDAMFVLFTARTLLLCLVHIARSCGQRVLRAAEKWQQTTQRHSEHCSELPTHEICRCGGLLRRFFSMTEGSPAGS